MRKTLLIIITFLLTIISIQFVSLADMDAPGIEPYEAYVSNVNGSEYFDYMGNVAGKLNYGDLITVYYEFENTEKNGLIAEFRFPENLESDMYSIDLKNIKPRESKVENFAITEKNKKELIILKEGGLELTKGPAFVYEKTGVVIPKGTKIDGYRGKDENSGLPWYYVTYKGTTGWICELDGAIGTDIMEYEDHKILTPRKIKIYKDSNYEKSVAEIPANTIITEFLNLDPWSQGYYVTYEGKSGYISMGDCATNFPWLDGNKSYEYKVNYPEAKLYKEADTKSEVLIENIPEGEILKYFYSDDMRSTGWIYTTYNNLSGWVFFTEDGYNYRDFLDFPEENEFNYELDENEIVENNIQENEVSTNEIITTGESNSKDSSFASATQIVILCAMWGLTIFVTSIVTIALVNKKKKE